MCFLIVFQVEGGAIKMLVNKKLILCYIVAVSSFLNAMKLSEIPQLNKLENYNEIKNIEVERVVDYDNYNRNVYMVKQFHFQV